MEGLASEDRPGSTILDRRRCGFEIVVLRRGGARPSLVEDCIGRVGWLVVGVVHETSELTNRRIPRQLTVVRGPPFPPFQPGHTCSGGPGTASGPLAGLVDREAYHV